MVVGREEEGMGEKKKGERGTGKRERREQESKLSCLPMGAGAEDILVA